MNKKTLIIVIVAVVFIIIIAAYFYYKGKRAAEGPKVTYPHGGSTIPAGWSPVPLADRLHDVMDTVSLTGTKDDAWKSLRDLPNDEMVIAVYDAYNQKYFKDGDGTLVQWISDETFYDYTSGVKESTLARLKNLQLA